MCQKSDLLDFIILLFSVQPDCKLFKGMDLCICTNLSDVSLSPEQQLKSMNSRDIAWNPGSITYQLWEMGQVTQPLCSSISPIYGVRKMIMSTLSDYCRRGVNKVLRTVPKIYSNFSIKCALSYCFTLQCSSNIWRLMKDKLC